MIDITPREKLYKIVVCSRVNLWLSNKGFSFVHAKYTRKDVLALHDWAEWGFYYPPYLRDNLVSKVAAFLDTFPDAFKSHKFYQSLQFRATD